jgi:hypothetical protein
MWPPRCTDEQHVLPLRAAPKEDGVGGRRDDGHGLFTVALIAQFRQRTGSGDDARMMTFIVDGIVCSAHLAYAFLTHAACTFRQRFNATRAIRPEAVSVVSAPPAHLRTLRRAESRCSRASAHTAPCRESLLAHLRHTRTDRAGVTVSRVAVRASS